MPLVALSAALWGTDALFRRGLALELPATTVVVYEHLILALIMAPILLRIPWRRLSTGDLWALTLIGAGASALATGLFTASFRFGDPNTPLLLQKLQPFIAIIAARYLLGERLRPRFGLYATAAVAAAWLITFPDPLHARMDAITAGALAAGAAALWALGTVLGRRMISRLSFVELTAARFGIGLPAALLFALLVGSSDDGWGLAIETGDLFPLLLLALVPGLLALLLYYRGLRRTPASAATLAELAFPGSALLVNYVAFGASVTATQFLGVLILSGTLVAMSLAGREDAEVVGIEASVGAQRAD
jgi:drug/metabolite transporter (DMT)-like permease